MSAKISPAFEPFLAESGPNDKREAIVIYQPPVSQLPVRGRLRELKARLDYVKMRAAVQKPVEVRISEDYKKAGSQRLRGQQEVFTETIGTGVLPIVIAEVTRTTLSTLAAQPDVIAILPNQEVQLIRPKRVAYSELAKQEITSGVTWGLERLSIPKLWESTRGEDVNVAVLDTGVYPNHPALAGRIKDFVVIDPLGRRISAKPAFDCEGHGTHVCGTIAGGETSEGVSIGVAPRASLLVATVLIGGSTVKTLIEGISWAIEKGADIINMSLGFSYYEPLFATVLDIITDQFGILPVVAIGNDNHGNTSSPGNVHSAFSVGAVEKKRASSNKVDVAFFSGGASLVFPGQEPNSLVTKPDVVAPGVQVYSCIPPQKRPDGTYEYTYMDGTSMAAPHVTGAAALLMSAKPEAPVMAIMQVLRETAEHPRGPQYRPDNRWGYGFVQPVEALSALD